MTSAEDVNEELPTPSAGGLVPAEEVESAERNLLAESGLSDSQEKVYDLLNVESRARLTTSSAPAG